MTIRARRVGRLINDDVSLSAAQATRGYRFYMIERRGPFEHTAHNSDIIFHYETSVQVCAPGTTNNVLGRDTPTIISSV